MKEYWANEKIRLRNVEIGDIETIYNRELNGDAESDRMSDEIRFPLSKEMMMKRVEYLAGKMPENEEITLIIEDKQRNAVGCINTFDCNKRNGTFKYGIGIIEKYRRKGYAKEAIIMTLRYYFNELRYQKVTVYIYSFNENSIKLHEKIGFKFEGRLRNMIYTNGKYYDEIMYGMTKEEYQEIDKE